MRAQAVRRVLVAVACAVSLAGCEVPGFGAATAAPSATPSASGTSWVVVAAGRATPGPTVPFAAVSPTPTPTTAPHAGAACGVPWQPGQVVIPVAVAPGGRSLTVTWSRYGRAAGYRIAAVPQRLVNGEQPPLRWQSVTVGSGCTVTATLSGLTAGAPYVVWLDALGTGHKADGSRNPYSGRSGVVYPT